MNKPLRALIVEDSEDDAELLLLELERGGYEVSYERVETAETMQAALARQAWDIVISDYSMPRFSAPAALRLLRECERDLPFIILSGAIGEEAAVATLKAGAHDFVTKNNLSRLVPAIERELRDAHVRLARKQAEEALRKARDELELRVRERTAELEKVNEALRKEIAERRQAEESLAASEKRFRALIENSTDGILLVDQSGNIVYVGPSTLKLSGYRADEIVGRNAFELLHPDDHDHMRGLLTELCQEPRKTVTAEYRIRRKDGTWAWREGIGANLLDEPSVLALVINYRDITERKRWEEQITASLAIKEALLKEIHHRVKNNLQVISSMLKLQSQCLADPQAIEMFKDSQSRVRSMAFIHEKLYQSQDMATIDFSEYVRDLAAHLLRSYQPTSNLIDLDLDIERICLGLDTAVPCGLIINELVSNSLKHAFPSLQGSDRGEIRIELRSDNTRGFTLKIRDNGVGFPTNLDFRRTESLGLQLVNLLTDQLGGTITLNRNGPSGRPGGGTEFEIVFAEVKYKERS